MSGRKVLLLFLKVVVSAAVLWFLSRKVDLSEMVARMVGIDAVLLAAGFVLLILQAIIQAIRWHLVLQVARAPLSMVHVVRLVLVSLFVAQVLPVVIGGDAVRTWLATRIGVPLGAAVSSVVLERASHFLGLCLLVLGGLPFFLMRFPGAAPPWVFVAVTGAGVAALAALLHADRLGRRFEGRRLARGLIRLATDTRALFLHPRMAAAQITLSVAGHALMATVVFLIGRGLGLDAGFVDCLVLVPPVMLTAVLPVSYAGWGVREAAMVGAFGMTGMASGDALTLSLVFAATLVASRLPGGVVLLLGRWKLPPPVDAT